MNINIICIGKLKEKYWREACAEYAKRLGAFCNLTVVELREARLPKHASEAEARVVTDKEGEEIIGNIGERDYVIALDIEGKALGSAALSNHLGRLACRGSSTVDFIIGGSLGLSDQVKRRADLRLSFSAMTFPHQMMRVILLEQIYRSFMISAGAAYHK